MTKTQNTTSIEFIEPHIAVIAPRQGRGSTRQLDAVERYVDADQAGEFLAVSGQTALRWARAHVIPSHAMGEGPRKRWRFLISELDIWMRSQSNDSQPVRAV